MFAGNFDEAIRRFEECVTLNLAEERPVAALVAEIAVCQAIDLRRTLDAGAGHG